MPKTPVAKFVCEHGYNFLRLALLNQGVVDDNMLFPWHAKEVRITVSTSLTTINDIQFMKWELQSLGKALNTGLQVAWLEGRELVEQGQDCDWVNGNHKDL